MDSLQAPVELKTIAEQLYASGQYGEAAEQYRKLVEAQPSSAIARKALALALVQAGSVDDGIAAAQEAARIAPMDPECRYAYGYALGAAQRYEEAIAEMDATMYLQPNHVPAKQ